MAIQQIDGQSQIKGNSVDTPQLTATAVTPATYGDATNVPQITVGQDGRVTSATDVAIAGTAPGGAAGGDLSGTYPNPSVVDDSHNHTSDTLSLNKSVAFTGDITPTQLAANTNNWNPTGLSTAAVIRASTDAARDLTGIVGGSDGRLLIVHNVGSFNLVLKDEDINSTDINRFALTSDMTLAPDAVVMLQYDATTQRWRAIGSTGGSAAAGGSNTQVQYNNSSSFGGISGATSDGTNLSVLDANLKIVDNADTTKVLQFQASGITPSTTRTLTAPDANTTIVGTDATQTLSNKTLTTPTIGDFTNATHDHSATNKGGAVAMGTATPTPVSSSGAAGSGTVPSKSDHAHAGVHSISKSGDTALFGDVTLSAGINVTLTESGNNISIGFGGSGTLEVKEQDGAPDVSGVTQIIVSNGTLTDNGAGSISITTGGGGGGDLQAASYLRASGDYTTTSTSFADVDATNFALTITTGAHRVMVTFTGGVYTATNPECVLFDIDIDGSRQGGDRGLIGVDANANRYENASFTFITDALSAGSHTFKLQWRLLTGGGETGKIAAAGTNSLKAKFSVVELYAA